ncbi:hypothetical protein CCMSSC00406_0007648 [Pleurotus cornucopiae]|uniref:Uncharacterized protein n=1 Tax=Pleurotus cornucopiae TaxID=5321 RepID=A0ACB7J2H5_PLECO|nr:hypothetical protein CCMSSC00406_0007648 [Pleurotus cornucopiae]
MTGLGGDQTNLHCQGCEQWKSHLLQYSPSVLFLMKHLKLSGCAVPPENIICAPCDPSAAAASSTPRSGGFSPTSGAILLCAGSFFSRSHMEQTLTHELVHLYDHCLFKVDWANLRHHACSEIRANSLSGDCKWTREVRRGVVRFSKQHQECVRRRAVLSVTSNAACPNKEAAERAVNEVWDSCFADTRPFDEIY